MAMDECIFVFNNLLIFFKGSVNHNGTATVRASRIVILSCCTQIYEFNRIFHKSFMHLSMIYCCLIFISVIYCTLHESELFYKSHRYYWGVKATNRKPCFIITITYTVMMIMRGNFYMPVIIVYETNSHSDLWFMIDCKKEHFYVLWSILMVFARKMHIKMSQ